MNRKEERKSKNQLLIFYTGKAMTLQRLDNGGTGIKSQSHPDAVLDKANLNAKNSRRFVGLHRTFVEQDYRISWVCQVQLTVEEWLRELAHSLHPWLFLGMSSLSPASFRNDANCWLVNYWLTLREWNAACVVIGTGGAMIINGVSPWSLLGVVSSYMWQPLNLQKAQ